MESRTEIEHILDLINSEGEISNLGKDMFYNTEFYRTYKSTSLPYISKNNLKYFTKLYFKNRDKHILFLSTMRKKRFLYIYDYLTQN